MKAARGYIFVVILFLVVFSPLPFGRFGGVTFISINDRDVTLPSVALMGDSIAIQYGHYLSDSLAECMNVFYLAKPGRQSLIGWFLDRKWVPLNVGTSQNLARVAKLLPEQRFDFLLVNAGLHDVKAAYSSRDKALYLLSYRKNLRFVFSVLGETAGQVGFVATTPVVENSAPDDFSNDVISEFNRVAEEESTLHDIGFIDAFAYSAGQPGGYYARDGYHLSELGSRRLSHLLGNYLLGNMKKNGRSSHCESS